MANELVWISGGSSGIGAALADSVPWPGARVIDVSRRGSPGTGTEHLAADLSDPASWPVVAASFRKEMAGFGGDAAVFVHAAGTIDPMGFAADVDPDAYARNVVLNSAAPQALGAAFLTAAADLPARRHVVMLTSGAARTPYEGWSSYGAGKAAVDQWVRTAGAEQRLRGGTHVLAVAPGTVDTGMQARIRETPERDFPKRAKFVDLHARGALRDPKEVAVEIWDLLDRGLESGAVVDLRDLAPRS